MPIVIATLADAISRDRRPKSDIAELCGVEPWTLSRWISGRRPLSEEEQIRLAGVLNLNLAELREILPTPKAAA